MIIASIIIPTYDRPELLLKTVQSGLRQNYPKDSYEIIIVDNGKNTERTERIIQPFFNNSKKYHLRYLKINKTGVHYARHAGAVIAKGNLLIFTDDDCIISRNLLISYISAFSSYPKMNGAGGPIKPRWETQPPKWLVRFIGGAKTFPPLSIMQPYDSFHLGEKGFFFSANIAIKKETLFSVGGFNPELIGENYIGDGETGLYKKMWKNNFLIGYVPNATVYHHISKERMTLKYLKLRMANEGISNIYSFVHPNIPNRGKLFTIAFQKLLGNIKLFIASFIYSGRTDVNSLNIQLRASFLFAQIHYLFKLIISNSLRSMVSRDHWLN